MLAWSIVSAMTGFIQSGASLIAVRLVLGMTESALFPSLNVYLSLFWKREEIGKRVACILAANSLAGALSGIFATVVTRIDGVGGYEGWRWLYFVEGMVSFVVSICFYFLIPDTPDDAYFLNAEEKEIAKGRMGGANTDVFNWPDVKAALTSPMCWLSACIELCADVYNFSELGWPLAWKK
jgi:MFS family permease